MLGGGGGPGEEALGPRPTAAELGAPLSSPGGGGVSRSGGWVSCAEVLAAVEVRTLRVGARLLPVAGHGVAAVVWTGRSPVVIALDATGSELGELQLSG